MNDDLVGTAAAGFLKVSTIEGPSFSFRSTVCCKKDRWQHCSLPLSIAKFPRLFVHICRR